MMSLRDLWLRYKARRRVKRAEQAKRSYVTIVAPGGRGAERSDHHGRR